MTSVFSLKRTLSSSLALIMALGLSGCGLIYTDVRVPRSYRSATPQDVKSAATDKTVSGEACSTAVLFLFAWGRGGYADAVAAALANDPGAVLYDAQGDMRVKSILGLYVKNCTIVTGKVGRP